MSIAASPSLNPLSFVGGDGAGGLQKNTATKFATLGPSSFPYSTFGFWTILLAYLQSIWGTEVAPWFGDFGNNYTGTGNGFVPGD